MQVWFHRRRRTAPAASGAAHRGKKTVIQLAVLLLVCLLTKSTIIACYAPPFDQGRSPLLDKTAHPFYTPVSPLDPSHAYPSASNSPPLRNSPRFTSVYPKSYACCRYPTWLSALAECEQKDPVQSHAIGLSKCVLLPHTAVSRKILSFYPVLSRCSLSSGGRRVAKTHRGRHRPG